MLKNQSLPIVNKSALTLGHKQQAIIWTNGDKDLWYHMKSLGRSELNEIPCEAFQISEWRNLYKHVQ